MGFLCIPSTRKDKGKACCCCSLALFALILTILTLARGIWLISVAIAGYNVILNWIFGILNIVMGLGGLWAVFWKSKRGISLLIKGWKIYLIMTIIECILSWILYGVYVNNDDVETDSIAGMILSTVVYLIVFVLFWWILSNFKSFAAVLEAGGSGWEKKSASELRGGGHVAHNDEV